MTTKAEHVPIVAGVDGSQSALSAVRWAAREAERHAAPLRLVHVCVLAPPGYPGLSVHIDDFADVLLEQGHRWLWEATEAAGAVAGGIEITTDLRDGTSTSVLIEESANARMLVVGSRGLGGFAELLVGSIAVTLAAHAHCPVVVVRPSTRDGVDETAPVVVGVDGSPLSDAAIAFAFEAAAARGVPLVAVHAWLDIELTAAWTPLPSIVDWAAVHANEERVLAERLAGWPDKYPTVRVRGMVSKDRPARALLRHTPPARWPSSVRRRADHDH